MIKSLTASLAALTLMALPAAAATVEFTLSGTGLNQNAGRTVSVVFSLDTDAPLLNAPTNEGAAHSFGAAALVDFSLQVRDASNVVLEDIGFSAGPSSISDVVQRRTNFGPSTLAGSTFLGVNLNASDLTGLASGTTTGFLNINLSSAPFVAFSQQPLSYVDDLLFDDPTSLLSNIQLGLPITRDNFNNVTADSANVGVNSSIIGNFLFDTASVAAVMPPPPPPNPNVVPLPAAGWLLIAGIGGLYGLRRRRGTA